MQCARCQQDNPPDHKFCSECGTSLQSAGSVQQTLSYADMQRSLIEALEQQTATGDILRVISSSPTDVQPVFDAIASSAARLSGTYDVLIRRLEGDGLRLVAHHGPIPALALVPVGPGFVSGRAVLERRIVHVVDVQAATDELPDATTLGREFGHRTNLGVPLLREGVPLGVILLRRAETRPFTDKEVALLKTFADQAVIAIENVRLFTELQEKNRALSESLEQQTATGEILRVISSSPTDLGPVFQSVAEAAARLLQADNAQIFRVEGSVLRIAASHGTLRAFNSDELPPISRGLVTGRAIIDRRTIHVHDLLADVETEYPEARELQRRAGHRTTLVTPMLRQGVSIGAISILRREVRSFTDKEIRLIETFADQAVIAIENVRLFTELETRNRDLTDALDRQTATAEILRVISQSPTDVQPVFDAIVDSAMRLFRAWATAVFRSDGHLIHLIAARGGLPGSLDYLRGQSPWPIHETSIVARCIADRAVVHIPDTDSDPSLNQSMRDLARTRGWRSILTAPMLRDGRPIGAINITRAEASPFSPAEIELIQTFADQAVIAIENARLLSELQARTQELTRSVGELQALGEVGQAISSTLDLQTVLSTIAARATQLSGTDAGVIYEYNEQREVFVPRATEQLEAEIVETMLATPVRKGEGATGRLAEVQEPIQVPDIVAAPAESRVRDALVRAGYRALLAVPLVREDHLIGGLTVIRKATGEFAPDVIELLRTFATQSALAIQNARLFLEIEEKSRQLEAASQHKSEFLANMSHELRTPLNAIIGFSEVLTDRMFGELNEKQEEYLKDIYASGTHLLSLINDILDLSKIEAGRMELEVSDFHLPTALDNALTLVRERAGRRNIGLHTAIDQQLGQIQADERKVRQIVLNLLSNAIKFTPEAGRIEVCAVPKDGFVEVSVSDTGIGIAPEDQEKVFEEFRQVGTAAKTVEGTGLGLTLCRKFVELHGGKIWVKSQLGEGSTFTFTIPVRRGD
jgi:two-component system, NtrC family, sensor kinase